MSSVAKKKLASLLQVIGETELKIEFARQKLCKCRSFEPYAAFQRIDRKGDGYITSSKIMKFMR